MPREISGLRIARSFVSPAGITEASRVIDFQLGARQGISIKGVIGSMAVEDSSTTFSASVMQVMSGVQTLHLESGSLETVPDQTGEDEDTIDSEVFYRQDFTGVFNDDATTEFRASAALMVAPAGLVTFPEQILVARNITHRAVNRVSTLSTLAHVLIYYTFVEFSLAELGLILARRT